MVPWDPLEKEVLKKSNCRPRNGLRCAGRQVDDMRTSNMAKNCGKIHFFHVSRHFQAPQRTRISVKIRFFGLESCPFNMDSPQLSILKIGLLWKELETFVWTWSFLGRMSMTCRPTRYLLYLGRQLDFLRNSFSGGSQGTMPSGETHLQPFWVTGGLFIS